MPEKRNSSRLAFVLISALVLAAGFATFALSGLSTKADAPKAAQAAPALTSDGLIADVAVSDENVGVAEEEVEKNYTRVDVGNLVLIKQKTADASLEEVINLFEDDAPVILATCYSVDACLKARQVMEPLAGDEVVQEAFYTVIIERFDSNKPTDPGRTGISYMFAMPKCGIDMGASEYTTTGLLEAAVSSYRNMTKTCTKKK